MSKTFEFPIDVFEIQFHFGIAKSFWACSVWEVKRCFQPNPKSFGISKMKLDFQDIDWEFKYLGHNEWGK